MKILSIHAENFASYKELDFEFDDEGLVLINGPTGSGKSTLADIIPWALFGVTAKNGKADEVLSWNGGETFATISIEINNDWLQITRCRKPNDLFFRLGSNTDANPSRGKDLQDTQKLINELLGMDADLYCAGAYYSEFSQTAQFFTTTAKNRRSITEQLVDLSLPVNLQDKIKAKVKEAKETLDQVTKDIQFTNFKLNEIQKSITYTKNLADGWSLTTSDKITQLSEKSDLFETTKRHKIHALETEMGNIGPTKSDSYYYDKILSKQTPESKACKECGGVSKKYQEHVNIVHELESERADNLRKCKDKVRIRKTMQEAIDSQNTYQEQIAELQTQVNPHTTTVLKLSKDLEDHEVRLETFTLRDAQLKDELLNLELLSDAVMTMRSNLIEQTISDLETNTNTMLRDHFDGEINVGLQVTDADKLDVLIHKDSNEASYTQLSKGQRGMLKLCFGVAVMQCVALHHALDIKQLWFDESLDGLDDTNKMKAVRMLETLALNYDTIYVVEHSETVKAMIDNKIKVELIDGASHIERS